MCTPVRFLRDFAKSYWAIAARLKFYAERLLLYRASFEGRRNGMLHLFLHFTACLLAGQLEDSFLRCSWMKVYRQLADWRFNFQVNIMGSPKVSDVFLMRSRTSVAWGFVERNMPSI